MENRSLLSLPALVAACGLLASPVLAQDGIQVVSNRVMDTLEAWSSPSHSVETLALDTHPELIESYVPELADHYGGLPLSEVFADKLPETAALFAGEIAGGGTYGGGTGAGLPGGPGAGALGDEELLAFAMSLGNEEYRQWQAGLKSSRLDFAYFVKRTRPDAIAALADLNRTPADRGVGLLDFAASLGDPALVAQVAMLAPTEPRRRCTCRVVVSFQETPAPWILEVNDPHFSQWGFPQKLEQRAYTVSGRGAARDLDYYRVSEQTLWEDYRDKSTNQSTLRLRMLCTIGAETACEANCAGQLALRIGYASRVYEKHDVGGTWSKESQVLTADLARLEYSGPASLPSPLFEKGVAVAGNYQSSWSSSAVANLLFSAATVTLAATSDDLSSTVDADLINTTVGGIAGLVTHSGSVGSMQRDMAAAWDNSASSQMITLVPNQTHLFELSASSKVYSRGYGKWSWAWGNLDSANYFVGVARHFACQGDVVAPPQQGFWLQAGSAAAPYSASTLQSLVGSFIQVELGQTVPATQLSNTIGVYP